MRAARQTLSIVDAIAIIVGIVVGAGIFKTPSIVAANTGSESAFLLAWVLGGMISLVGALCYAELASTYPSEGGDFHYFSLGFGRSVAFLFAWATGLNHRIFGNLNFPYAPADIGDLDAQVRGLIQNPRQFQFGIRVSF